MGEFLEDQHQPVGLTQSKIKKSNMQDASRVTVQADDSLDLTTSDQVTLTVPNDELEAGEGYDSARAIKIHSELTTKLQADGTVPEVNLEDGNGNSTGLALTTYSNDDSVGSVRNADISGGSKVKAVDLSAGSLTAKVTTVADDTTGSDTTGTALIWAEVIPEQLH